jgi:hypothetical protein
VIQLLAEVTRWFDDRPERPRAAKIRPLVAMMPDEVPSRVVLEGYYPASRGTEAPPLHT